MIDLTGMLDATWPADRKLETPGFILRAGQGGGKRVSAATAADSWTASQIAPAEAAMRGLGQTPLFMIRQGEAELDAELEARGYRVVDPTVILSAPIDAIDDRDIPRVTAFTIWEPLAIMYEIWAAAGIGPARLAVMDRVTAPKTAILGRINDNPGGVAFAAIADRNVVVHAVEVVPKLRNMGLAKWMMRQAARWGRAHGATHLVILVTRANATANALYAALGMSEIGGYHYRTHPEETP
ncbi:GNAT family N-acetyltransferase [Roseivivax sp. CAU 1753]